MFTPPVKNYLQGYSKQWSAIKPLRTHTCASLFTQHCPIPSLQSIEHVITTGGKCTSRSLAIASTLANTTSETFTFCLSYAFKATTQAIAITATIFNL